MSSYLAQTPRRDSKYPWHRNWCKCYSDICKSSKSKRTEV